MTCLLYLRHFRKPDQTFSLVALIDDFSQWFQLLVLVRLHRLEVNMDLATANALRLFSIVYVP